MRVHSVHSNFNCFDFKNNLQTGSICILRVDRIVSKFLYLCAVHFSAIKNAKQAVKLFHLNQVKPDGPDCDNLIDLPCCVKCV